MPAILMSMMYRNTWPENYADALAAVIRGDAIFSENLAPMLASLNPAKVSRLAGAMSNVIWDVHHREFYVSAKSASALGALVANMVASRPELAGVFSVSPNGYVREWAVRQWTYIGSPFELALLLIRLNDWVAPVRATARKTLGRLLAQPRAQSGLTSDTILGCMDILLRPERLGRAGPKQIRALRELLVLDDMPMALVDFITETPGDAAPRYLKLGLRQGLLMDALPYLAMSARHAEVRRVALHACLSGQLVWRSGKALRSRAITVDFDRETFHLQGLRDKSAAVRATALSDVVNRQSGPYYTEIALRDFVRDSAFSVADLANFGLKTLGVDYLAELRAALENCVYPPAYFSFSGEIRHRGRWGG